MTAHFAASKVKSVLQFTPNPSTAGGKMHPFCSTKLGVPVPASPLWAIGAAPSPVPCLLHPFRAHRWPKPRGKVLVIYGKTPRISHKPRQSASRPSIPNRPQPFPPKRLTTDHGQLANSPSQPLQTAVRTFRRPIRLNTGMLILFTNLGRIETHGRDS